MSPRLYLGGAAPRMIRILMSRDDNPMANRRHPCSLGTYIRLYMPWAAQTYTWLGADSSADVSFRRLTLYLSLCTCYATLKCTKILWTVCRVYEVETQVTSLDDINDPESVNFFFKVQP